MKSIRSQVFAVLAVVAFAAIFSSCASVPTYDSSKPPVSLTQATYQDVRKFGNNNDVNPYFEPSSLIRGKLNEFFIVKLSFNLPKEAEVSIIADATQADGQEAAKVYTLYDFIDFWDINTTRQPDNDAKIQLRKTNIERSCVPALQFKQGAGQNVLFLPFIGKNPIPRPAKMYVQVEVAGTEPAVFSYDLK